MRSASWKTARSRKRGISSVCDLTGKWRRLTAKEGTFAADDVIGSLDVSILQDNLLAPILGIKDPRTDERINFMGGIRGLDALAAESRRRGLQCGFCHVSDVDGGADQGS